MLALVVVTGGFVLTERFKHQIVTSSAGCGKTTRLAKEYLARVKKGTSPSNLLAITFTNLAASEMKERLIERLREEHKEEWEKFNRGELQLRVSTIHSFLADLLVRYCFNLGLNPGFEVLNGCLIEELWEESINEQLEDFFLSGQAEIYEEIFKEFGLSFLKKILKEAYSLRPATDLVAAEEVTKRLSGKEPKTIEEKFVLLFDQILQRFQAKKRDLGVVDFPDLEILVLNFLRTNPDFNSLLLFFNEHFHHLLVDEFQDTSLVQWEIIKNLVGDWLAGAGLREVFDNSLFLVGDAKQSIYRFRGAEVGVFKKVVREFSALAERGGSDHYLPVEVEKINRRSSRKIIDFANWFFPYLKESSECKDSFVYHDFLPARTEEGLVEAKFFLLEDKRKGSKEMRVNNEAFWVAERIADLIESGVEIGEKSKRRPLRFSDIAIIMRNATHSLKFERELKKRGFPYYVRKGKDFYRQPEISFLVQALRFVANENNDLALFSLLQSPVFGYDLTFLLKVLRRPGGFFWQNIQEDENFALTSEVLKSWLRKRGKSPTELVEFILESSGAFSIFTLPSQIFNLEKFFLVLSQLELSGFSTVESVAFRLDQVEVEEENEAEIPADESIRILTVHSSKGLEFPVVFVVLIDEFGSVNKGANWFYLNSDPEAFNFQAFIRKPQVESDKEFLDSWAKENFEEEKRLLYVAFTRARDFLFLTGGGTLKDTANNKTIFGRLYQLISNERPELISDFEPEKREAKLRKDLEKPHLIPLPGKLSDFSDFKKGEPITREITYTSLAEKSRACYGEVFHRLLEWLSRQSREGIQPLKLLEQAKHQINDSLLDSALKRKLGEDLMKLYSAGYLEKVVLYQPSLEEKAFFGLEENVYFERRFDKVLFKGGEVWLVDYKTDEVKEEELGKAVEFYRQQLSAYRDIASNFFHGKKVRTFLLFTGVAQLVEF